MRAARLRVLIALAFAVAIPLAPALDAQPPRQVPLYQQFLSPATPLEIAAARKADRIAWMAYEEGKRNVYTAAAPSFRSVRLTSFLKDDGIDLSNVRISDDGTIVTFVRGTQPNRDGWVANASANPDGADRTVWVVRTAGGPARRLAEIAGPQELAPDGSSVLFVKDGQIYRVRTSAAATAGSDRAERPFITAWGVQSSPRWSPDGRKIAFVSTRTDHSFVAVYDTATRKITYMSPSVDFDTSPMWSGDGSSVVFVRRPGLPFGQQAQPGIGSLGNPNGPAFNPNAPQTGRGGRGQGVPGAGFGRGQAAENPNVPPAAQKVPGLTRATFKGGHTLAIVKADAATGEAREVWHNEPNDRIAANIVNPRLAGTYVIFPFNQAFGGGRGGRGRGVELESLPGPVDEWERYYSLDISKPGSRPLLLTTTEGLIEGQTDVALSPDGTLLYYCTNAKDIERRHIWAVPVAGGTPTQVTTGQGIETYPAPLASGKAIAALSAGWKLPQSIGIWSAGPSSAAATMVFPSLKAWPPADIHVEPQPVMTKAADGLEIHNQLFLPKDIRPGERRPAIVFVHGGPVRQMLLGYHYMHFYHWAYAINQWLASQGYIVLSVNYRSGIGYGHSFRNAPNTGSRGNAEYQDVVAGGKYLQARPDVDPNRVAIWGLSYGGLLTAQALARNSDIFRAGVDLAGVHLWSSSLDPESASYKSSVVGAIDGWKSPVLLVHGDDDRNVAFQQTTGLVQLLRQRDVEFELIVFPDDTHESMLHSRWLYTLERMQAFLRKHLGGGKGVITER